MDDQRREVENFARAYRAVAGGPIIVSPALYRRLVAFGFDVSEVRVAKPIEMIPAGDDMILNRIEAGLAIDRFLGDGR